MKLEDDYFIIEKTWNRNILRGPYHRKYIDTALENLINHAQQFMAQHGGAPISFIVVKKVKTARVVYRGKRLAGVERTPEGKR